MSPFRIMKTGFTLQEYVTSTVFFQQIPTKQALISTHDGLGMKLNIDEFN